MGHPRCLRGWGTLVFFGVCFNLSVAVGGERIATLSPHLTEMVFDLGRGQQLVGVSRFSDHPPAALELPIIGDALQINLELIIELDPDQILTWQGGSPRSVTKLEEMGYSVFKHDLQGLESIGAGYRALGGLIGAEPEGERISQEMEAGIAGLRSRFGALPAKRVFLQIASDQLFTVNGEHYMGQAIEICGAENIFKAMAVEVAVVSLESVIQGAPDVVVIISENFEGSTWRERWEDYVPSTPVRGLNADLLSRPARRILKGIEQLCEVIHLDGV